MKEMLTSAKHKLQGTLVSEIFKGDIPSIVKFLINNSDSILEIGCGIGDYLKFTNSNQSVEAVEPHSPYIKIAQERAPWAKIHNSDAHTFFKTNNKKFDLILMIDVIEHLEEEQSIQMVEAAKKATKNILFSQIPYGIHMQNHDEWELGGEYWQTHRSFWNEENIGKLDFEKVFKLDDFYESKEIFEKDYNSTILGFWFSHNGVSNFDNLSKQFSKYFELQNFTTWQKAYVDGYNSSMGNHINYFYNTYISEIGFYNNLEIAKNVVEFAPGDASFMKVFIEMFPEKEFNLIDISEKNLANIKLKLEKYSNVKYFLNYPEVTDLGNIDLAFSFLLCQSMPKTLWISHLEKVYNMLNINGAYFFQFAYHPDGFANDSIDVAISGGNKYTPEEIASQLEKTGFKGCDFTIPIELKELNTDIIWYLCKAYK